MLCTPSGSRFYKGYLYDPGSVSARRLRSIRCVDSRRMCLVSVTNLQNIATHVVGRETRHHVVFHDFALAIC
jgi:hypothetical protein